MEMTPTQVAETLVTDNNSPIQDDHILPNYEWKIVIPSSRQLSRSRWLQEDPTKRALTEKNLVFWVDGHLRWLHRVFHGQYLPILSINYVAINKDLAKLPQKLY